MSPAASCSCRICSPAPTPRHRLKVRVITEQAWHNLFARNMFIRPAAAELAGFQPDWTVLQLPSLEADPALDGTNSDDGDRRRLAPSGSC